MHFQTNEEIENTVRLTEANIQEKRYTYSLAKAEFNRLCVQSENLSKIVDEIKEKKYLCENLVKTCESRITEYEKSEKEFEKEAAERKKAVTDLKLNILEIQKTKENEDKLFNHDVMQLVEKMCSEREFFYKNALNEELQCTYEESKAYDQELKDLRNLTEEIKSKCPIFTNSKELIIENCMEQIPFIKEEIRREKLANLHFAAKEKVYEITKSAHLQEIHKMEVQL